MSLEFHNTGCHWRRTWRFGIRSCAEKAGLDIAVFEREASRDGRTQGGTLDLHVESGQWALEQAGLLNEFRAMARPEGQDLRIANKHGKLLWDEISEPDVRSRPEIDRPRLRKILLDSLAPETIRWNYNLSSVEPADGGAWPPRSAL